MEEIKNINTLLKYAIDLEDFIFGKVDKDTLLRMEGLGRRPTQQDKDKLVKSYGRKINFVQMAAKKILEKKSNGYEVSEKEQELLDIISRINNKYPPQKRREMIDIVINLDEKIRGTLNPETGKREGGLNKRPSDKSKNSEEADLGTDFQRVKRKVAELKAKQKTGAVLTSEEQRIIEIYESIDLDYPTAMEHKSLLEIAQDVLIYINGTNGSDGLGRRPRTQTEDRAESSKAYQLRHLERKVKKLKEESNDRALTETEKKLIEIIDSISFKYPTKKVNSTMLDPVRTLEKYIRGGFDERTGITFPGIKRRPNALVANTNALESKFLSIYKNAWVRVQELQKSERQLSFNDTMLIEIMEKLYEDYPPLPCDTDRAIDILTDYIYNGMKREDGTIIEAIHKRPAKSSGDTVERNMANKLGVLSDKVRTLSKSNKSYENLKDDEIRMIEFLHKLDKDYPSRKKKRTELLKYCDRIVEYKAQVYGKDQNSNVDDGLDL